MQRLSDYFKPAKIILRFIPIYIFFLYKMFETRIPDTLPERFQLIFNAFREYFDPAIGQIPHRASDFEPVGD